MQKQRAISTVVVVFTMVSGVILFFRGVLFQFPVKSLWASSLDTPLYYWIINWGYHILFELHNPTGFFNSNSFFPQQNTLAYSDSLLGLQIFYGFLRLFGFNSLEAIYISLACLVILAGLFTFSGLRRIEHFSSLELSFLLFGSFFSLPVTNYLVHYQLFGFFLIPPFLLFLFLFFRDLRPSDLAWLCGIFFLAVTISLYLAPILFLYSIFFAPFFILFYTKQKGIPYLQKIIDWRWLAILIFFCALVYFLQLRPYFLVKNQPSTDTIERIILFSAMPLSLFQNVSEFSFWYHPVNTFPGAWESAYFPGYTLLLLCLAYIIKKCFGVLFPRQGRTVFYVPEDSDLFTVYMILFFLMSWLFSLGPYLKQDTNSAFSIPLPLYYLAKFVPGLAQVRAPGRFGMMIGFPLSLIGIRVLNGLPIREKMREVALILAFVSLLVESFPVFPVYSFQPDPTGVYHWLSGQIRPEQSLVELPLSTIINQGGDKYTFAIRQLVGSTFYWGRIASGYGAYETYEYQALLKSDLAFQEGHETARNILNKAKHFGFEYLKIDVQAYSLTSQASWRDLVENCSSIRYYNPGEIMLIHLQSCQ